MTIAQIKNAVRRGRPMKTAKLTADEMSNAVSVDVRYNHLSDQYDYAFGAYAGSAANVDYIRNRVIRGNLKSLADVSNNFARAFVICTTDKNDNQTVMYVKKS